MNELTGKQEQLGQLYVEKKLRISKIAKLFGESPERIVDRLEEYGIPIRNKRCVLLKYKPNSVYTTKKIGSGKRHVGEYIQIPTSEGWVLEHRYIWQKHNGPIPRGWIVHHLNGIKNDNRIENLVAVSRTNHSPMDSYRARIILLEQQVKDLEELVKVYEEIIAG